MNRCLIVVILLAVLALGVCGACTAAVTTTWPQTFSLCSGVTAKYTFEVSYQGQIVVDVAWQAGGLTVLLTDPSGNIVNLPPSLKQSPLKMLYTVTAADLQKGKQWTLTIYPPPMPAPSQKPVAVGTVTVTPPSGIAVLPPTGLRVVPGTPSIEVPVPNYGSPNDTITIKGRNIPDDKTKADIWFDLGASVPTQGTIVSASKSGDVITYQVRVPGNDYLYNSHQGPLYVKLRATGAVTNSQTFTFVPCPVPTITSHSPQYGKPGVTTTFTGKNFRQTDKVYFVVPGQADIGAQTSYHSPTEIAAALPSTYPTNVSRSIIAYVRYDCKGHWMNGARYTYPLDPSTMNAKP